ncbi:MAG TPA: phage holin family protein [Verrucomicrobiae bacterium]|nr:phage holin family protein [Verrucomicrobiae bacterium]
MDHESEPEDGLVATAARVLKTVRAAVVNRIELFLVELQEERLRLLDALLLLLVGVVFALMALILVTFIIVILFWETHRLLVLILLAAAYAAAAVTAIAMVYSRLRRWRAFSETLEQIKKDRACLDEQN